MPRLYSKLKLADAHVRAALVAAANVDQVQLTTNLQAVQKLGPGLNKLFDAAGLRDCGSNQQ